MTEIELYLKDPSNTQQGIALYSQYGRNKNLMRRFSQKPEQMKSKLLYELGKIRHKGSQVESQVEEEVENDQTNVSGSVENGIQKTTEKMQISVAKGEKVVVEKNTALEQLNAQRANLYKDNDALFYTKLNKENTKKERFEAAKTIVTNVKDKIDPINKKIDQILAGELPEPEEVKPAPKKRKNTKKQVMDKYDITDIDDRAELMKLLTNVRTNISKNKNNEARRKEWEAKKIEIEAKLGE